MVGWLMGSSAAKGLCIQSANGEEGGGSRPERERERERSLLHNDIDL